MANAPSMTDNVEHFSDSECRRAGWKAHKPLRHAVADKECKSSASRERDVPKTVARDQGRIFISIAAYCDPELPNTLRSLLLHAERPDLLYLGLIWQGEAEPFSDEDMADIAKLWNVGTETKGGGMLPLPNHRRVVWDGLLSGRIRLVRMLPSEARGPCWARYLAQLLWREEEFYLQLDSHMRFVPRWDTEMHRQLAACAESSAKPVLCGYGRGYQLGYPPDWVPPGALTPALNCAGFFDDYNILNIRYRTLQSDWLHPQKSFFWSAHFSFSSSAVLREVPYDPVMQMLFYGEEILMSVRLFTHGWDMYSPQRALVYHLWERDYRRVYFFDQKELYTELAKPSRRRLHGLLGSGKPNFFDQIVEDWPLPGDKTKRRHEDDPFALGSVRSVKDYEDAADVDFKGRRLGAFALRGGAPSEMDFVAQESGNQAEIEARCRKSPAGGPKASAMRAEGSDAEDAD